MIFIFLVSLLTLLPHHRSGAEDRIFMPENKADSCLEALNYDCAITYYLQALTFEQEDSTLTRFLSIRNKISDLYFQQGQFEKARENYQVVLDFANKHEVIAEKAKALRGLSHIFWRYGDNVTSIQFILESIDLFKSIDDHANTISASNILAGIYLSTGEITKAHAIYEETTNLAKLHHDSVGMAQSLEYKGVIKVFEKKYKEAIKFYKQSLDMNIKIGNELAAGITLSNVGEAYFMLGDHKNALRYFDMGEDIMNRHNFNSGLIFLNYSAGQAYLELGQLQKAHQRFDRSLQLIRQTGETRELPMVLALKSKCYAHEKKYDSAYYMHLQYALANDSITAANNNNELMEIMSKYEFEKKEQENEFLMRENQIKASELESKQSIITLQYVIVGVLVIFLVVVLYLFVKLYRNKQLLTKANQTKNMLFGFIAHDIKSPLGNIQMLAHMLQGGFANTKEEQGKILTDLNNAAYAVVQLADDLISWSVTQKDGLVLTPENVSVGEIIKDNLELFYSQIEFKNLNIENKVPPHVTVFADKKVVFSILRNVLSNAVKFSHKEGKITITTAEHTDEKSGRDMIEIKVRDNGLGMSREKSEMILTADSVESTYGTADEKGSGLGLKLVREFVQKSNGLIKIKSKPDKGTKFSIVLPSGS